MAYQKTLFDRLGPEAANRLQLVGPGLIVALLVTITFRRGGASLPLALIAGVVAAFAVAAIILRFADAAGSGFMSFIWPSGGSAPYAKQYSLQESLAVRGDTAGAIASYEDLISGDPADLEARIRVAELHAGKGNNPQRAAECFREARRVEGIPPERDLYISNRLIDLLRGPLRDEGRALVELRRMVQLHPSSRDAVYAREAIAKLKVESIKDARDT